MLTIGVVINVGNYESLRLEVSDCVQTEKEAGDLAVYLNCILDGYAQNDATTRAIIDKYRARVLERRVPQTSTSLSHNLIDNPSIKVTASDKILREKDKNIPESEKIEKNQNVFKQIITDSEHVKIEGKPSAAAEEQISYVCENCGVSVSKVQRDVSNLFMGKTLCKVCMK